jgi:hypothetical protein
MTDFCLIIHFIARQYSDLLRATQSGFDSLQGHDFSLSHRFQAVSGANPATHILDTGGYLPSGKATKGRS